MKSKTNDQTILEKIIRDRFAASQSGLSESEYFEIFSASQILKNLDLSHDDIEGGIVGNGADGGIDSIYTFLNGELLTEDTSINLCQKKNSIEVHIIQSKTSPNFKEDAILRFRESAEDLFNLSNSSTEYAHRYNAELRGKVDIFKKAYGDLAVNFPKLSIKYYYVTQGTEVASNVEGKVEKLKESVLTLFSGSEFEFQFIGAARLLELTRDVPSQTRILEVSESPIGTAGGSYICLVRLQRYHAFISDNGTLARSIFESNVRDYQGSVTVNTGIRKTLQNQQSEDFWYLNNGVTIVASKAVLAGKQLTIEDPRIVNGLQTSHEIYQHFSEANTATQDDRTVLVRVICESDDDARDRIIRATNSQTAIPPASLRSSDEIHRNIEDFFKANDLFYDRKKNFYKNQGKAISKIVSIPYMAQVIMSVVLLKPDQARARPSTLLNSDSEYRKIFSLDRPIDVYLKAIQIARGIQQLLKMEEADRKAITNIKFHAAMAFTVKLSGGTAGIDTYLSNLPRIELDELLMKEAIRCTKELYTELGATDQISKSRDFVDQLLERLSPEVRA